MQGHKRFAMAFGAACALWMAQGAVFAQNVEWKRSEREAENPLTEDGHLYNIYLELADGVKPGKDEVILAHVEIDVEITCACGTTKFKLDYWEAFQIHEDGSAGADTHSLDREELLTYAQSAGLMDCVCGCGDMLKMVVTRKHTISLGTAEDPPWFDNGRGKDLFAYLLYGPDGAKVTPAKRPEKVKGKVTSFKKEGAITFTGTYTWTASGGATYESSLGKKYELAN